MFKVALFDDREDSPTHGEVNQFFLGDYNPTLLQIPPGVYHGWKCISEREGIVVNVSTETYNYDEPDEFRLPFDTDKIPYDWDIQMG